MSVNTAPNSFYDPEEEANQWFDEKHPNASCERCEKKLSGATVHFCDFISGCETWFCEDCKVDADEDGGCTICRKEKEEEEWMDIYSQHKNFEEFCGDHEHLKPYHGFSYFQCWGGGPEGGFIMNDKDETFKVNRTWGEPFTVEPVDGILDFEFCGVLQLRVVPRPA